MHYVAIGGRPIEVSSGFATVRRSGMEDIPAILYSTVVSSSNAPEAQEVHAWTSEISYVGKVALGFPPRHSGRVAEPGMLSVRELGFVKRPIYYR